MIEIRPCKDELKNAFIFAEKYDRGNFGKNVLGVSHEEYIEFIRIGKLCELMFVRILSENNISCRYDEMLIVCKDEHRKGPDLVLSHSGQEVDIKAANKLFHTRLLVREDQFKAHIHDLYVGSKYIDDSLVQFHGYVTGKELGNIEPQDFGYGLCRHVPLNELKSIENFISLCKQNKKVE